MKIRNVLSLFDGISCGQVALNRANIQYEKYYASEIEESAITITKKNFPKTIFLGDVNNWENWNIENIDLLIGGSPCQDLSSINPHNVGLYGEKSILFFKFVQCLKHYKPKYFLFENVKSMSKNAKNIITELLGVTPICLDSSLVSAQHRERLYWTNIPIHKQLEDKHIMLWDILEHSHIWKPLQNWCFKYYGKIQRINLMTDYYSGKMRTLTTQNVHPSMYIRKNDKMTTLTPNEYEKLQTLDVDYTKGISNVKRFRSIGNGWTVDIIKYIFENMED